MKYISVFSGIGGLESAGVKPVLVCDSDPSCRSVLQRRFADAAVHDDVTTLDPPVVDIVVGGWPCQDLTVAGKMGGIESTRSGLFFSMVKVAKLAKAHTLIGENVPNLVVMRNGKDFDIVLSTLVDAGFPYITWRTLNAREFSLPQERNRVFIVASKYRETALALHCEAPVPVHTPQPTPGVAGFYWTAGGRSLCFFRGYVPALKIGASDNKGRSPIAVFYDTAVRKLTTSECLRLQGFDMAEFNGISASNALRMAGNAVPLPIGNFVVDSVLNNMPSEGTFTGFDRVSSTGFLDAGKVWSIAHRKPVLANNLGDFVDTSSKESLSAQAAAGLLCRIIKSGYRIPLDLYDALCQISVKGDRRVRGARSNSFETIKSLDPVQFRKVLATQ